MALLIYLVIVLLFIGLVYYAVNAIPLPPPVRVIAVVIVAIVGAVWLLSLLGGGGLGLGLHRAC